MVDADQYWSEAQCELIRTVVVKKHEPSDDTQLTLKVNDIVIVMEKDETGWWGGHKEGEEATGWFPGICVQPIEGFEPRDSRRHSPVPVVVEEPETERCKEGDLRESRHAVETGSSSPVRRSYAVASPQRMSAASAQGSQDVYAEVNSQILESHNALAADRQALLVQVEQLQRDNRVLEDKHRALEERLQRQSRQSECDRRRFSQLEESFASLEAKHRQHLSELQATRNHKDELSEVNSQLQKQLQVSATEKERLQAEVRWGKEEVQSLSTKLEAELGQKSELSAEKDRLLRRVQELETPVHPTVPSEEERPPPAGVVKQLRDAFEHAANERATTPTPRRLCAEPSKERAAWAKASVSAAPQMATSQAYSARCGGHVQPRREPEEDSEFSPFHRGKKDVRVAYPSEAPCMKMSLPGSALTA
mmetsp:Transcript_62992/g.147902  ORF Transcript_62992/g.147902 Transcript_62992/m.147902 type:complete len:421 (+) Transcript_62992:54-1316(+)